MKRFFFHLLTLIVSSFIIVSFFIGVSILRYSEERTFVPYTLFVPFGLIAGITLYVVTYNKLANKQTVRKSISSMLNFFKKLIPLMIFWIAITITVGMLNIERSNNKQIDYLFHIKALVSGMFYGTNTNNDIPLINENVKSIKNDIDSIKSDVHNIEGQIRYR